MKTGFLTISYASHSIAKMQYLVVSCLTSSGSNGISMSWGEASNLQPGKANLTGPGYIGWLTNLL